jgi:hypothetical protein
MAFCSSVSSVGLVVVAIGANFATKGVVVALPRLMPLWGIRLSQTVESPKLPLASSDR